MRVHVRLFDVTDRAVAYLTRPDGPYMHQSQAIQAAMTNAVFRDFESFPDGTPTSRSGTQISARCASEGLQNAVDHLDNAVDADLFETRSHAIRAAIIVEACLERTGFVPEQPTLVIRELWPTVTDQPDGVVA